MAQELIPAGSLSPTYSTRPEDRGGWEAIQQIFFVLFKWKRTILSLFFAFTIAAGLAMYLKPPVRSATAEILIKGDRTPLRISGLTVSSKGTEISQILNSEVELIRSRKVLRPVAVKLLSAQRKPGDKITEAEIDTEIEDLAGDIFPVALPDTNVVRVTYFAKTAKEATRTLSLIIREYIEKQAAIQTGSSKLLQFYGQEKQRVETRLREAEERLNKWQDKNDTVSINEQITSQLNILGDRKKTLQQTESQLAAVKAKLAMLKKQLKGQPERLVTGREQVKNPLVTRLKSDLVTAQVVLRDLLQRYTDKNRLVREKREQIAFIQKELATAQERVVGKETTGLNPLRVDLRKQLSDSQAQLSSLISQKDILEKQIQKTSAILAGLRGKKVEIDSLSRVVDLRKETFMLYGKKLEEARIATGLGEEQLANVALIGPPHASLGTDLKKRVMMVIFSAFVGVALGMAIAFGFEFFNNSLRTRQDVEFYLGLPVLATVPELAPNLALDSRANSKGD